jgi:hypothetical protein
MVLLYKYAKDLAHLAQLAQLAHLAQLAQLAHEGVAHEGGVISRTVQSV